MSSPEQPISPELRPAEKMSVQEFLRNAKGFSVGGFQDRELDPYEVKSYTLSDGRKVSVGHMGPTSEDLSPEEPMASLWVVEVEGDEQKQTGYLLYDDGRMEKVVDIESIEQIKKEFAEGGIGQKYQDRMQAVREERKLGLRAATEADMQETRELFVQLDKIQKEESLK